MHLQINFHYPLRFCQRQGSDDAGGFETKSCKWWGDGGANFLILHCLPHVFCGWAWPRGFRPWMIPLSFESLRLGYDYHTDFALCMYPCKAPLWQQHVLDTDMLPTVDTLKYLARTLQVDIVLLQTCFPSWKKASRRFAVYPAVAGAHTGGKYGKWYHGEGSKERSAEGREGGVPACGGIPGPLGL